NLRVIVNQETKNATLRKTQIHRNLEIIFVFARCGINECWHIREKRVCNVNSVAVHYGSMHASCFIAVLLISFISLFKNRGNMPEQCRVGMGDLHGSPVTLMESF